MEFVFEGMGTGLSIFYIIYSLAGSVFGIALYVLRALSLYTISKRRGINHPWMSWVPVLDLWVIGCISDQYQYVVKGRDKNKRKWLLGLNIVMAVIYVVMFVLFGMVIFNTTRGILTGMDGNWTLTDLVGPAMGMLACLLPLLCVAVAVAVIRYVAMYDLYTSCTPQNNVMFLILSIFFTVTEPFFLICIRKKDDGMPPRRVQSQYETAQEV